MTKKCNRKIIIGLTIGCLAAILALVLILTHFNYPSGDEVVATVNGMDITAEELEQHMSQNKAYVITYFQEKYNATVDSSFWDKEYDGVTPYSYLRQTALDELTKYKIEQKLAVDHGLLKQEDMSYKAFLKQLEEENETRKQKIANGEVVYGASSYTKESFFGYTYSNLQLKLQEVMSKENEPLFISDDDLKKWYDSQDSEEYISYDKLALQVYSVSEDQDRSVLNEIKQCFERGESADDIKSQYPNVTFSDMTLDDDNAASIQKEDPELFELVYALQEGQVSNVISDHGAYVLFKCVTRQKGGVRDFKTYKDGLRKDYIQQAYTDYIDKLVEQAEVKKLDTYSEVKLK